VLYISDFDPAGLSMPVACARKLEFMIRDGGLDIDLQLRPVVLTKEQCEHYRLPRTPIKETERRAGAFEARFGGGATELDALEALHPGELQRLLVVEIERYYDTDLASEIRNAASEIEDEISDINEEVIAEYQPQIDELEAEADDLNDKIKSLWHAIETELINRAPDIEGIEWPEPSDGDPDPDPLFDSNRDYMEQLDRYKLHQGKTTRERDKRATVSEETRAKMAANRQGRTLSEETKARMRAAQQARRAAAKNGGGDE
jgi:hypothetical protein